MQIFLLDYGAGNVRSVASSLEACGVSLRSITSAADIEQANIIVFPGVGRFSHCVEQLKAKGLWDALGAYVKSGRPYLGICVGMQVLFASSEEGDVEGLGLFNSAVGRFSRDCGASVPQIGWNGVLSTRENDSLLQLDSSSSTTPPPFFYFVHSYRVAWGKAGDANPSPSQAAAGAADWAWGLTDYGNERFVSCVFDTRNKSKVIATQFHPEKSGKNGMDFLRNALSVLSSEREIPSSPYRPPTMQTQLARRVVAALDVRENDDGDLVVTKGDQYDVREKTESSSSEGRVRNLGKPVELAERYSEDGADEIAFLNITSFRSDPVEDAPMLQILEKVSEKVRVPLCIGGGIREYTDSKGRVLTAVDVSDAYFRAGADKISIGSDAVLAAEQLRTLPPHSSLPSCSIAQISGKYGAQAVVVSIDPKRFYFASREEIPAHFTPVEISDASRLGPNKEPYCVYKCTIKGGREVRDIDAIEVAKASERLGAGELMVNCIDEDGQGRGFDGALLAAIRASVSIPVIASSGAGCPEHFVEVFKKVGVESALAAGIFHRREVEIKQVKQVMAAAGLPTRL